MKRLTPRFAPEAELQLTEIYRHIARAASPKIALTFTDAIVARCEDLAEMPLQGRSRDDIRKGMRTMPFRRRVLIAYAVSPRSVTILGVFYGGQDFEALLRED